MKKKLIICIAIVVAAIAAVVVILCVNNCGNAKKAKMEETVVVTDKNGDKVVKTKKELAEEESSKKAQTAFPQTEYQRCIVHQVRNTLKYVADKDRKPFAADLKRIYQAPNEQRAAELRDTAEQKWGEKYPKAMKSWYTYWDAITPIFKFSADVRTVIYTTNAIESLNSTYRRLNRQRSVFPSDQALLKALYLATFEATKKWTMPIRNWGKVYGELSIMYDGRLPE